MNVNYLTKFSDRYSHPAIVLWRSVEAKYLSQILNQVNFNGPILDLGCGEGKVSSVIFNHIDVGLDIEIGEIKKAKSIKSYKTLVFGNACFLPFTNESFNLVFSNSVIEHIPNLENVLKETSRVLKYGGYFCFTVPSVNFGEFLFFHVLFDKLKLKKLANWYSSKRNEYLNHYNILSLNKWTQRLEKVNLKIIGKQEYLSKSAIEIWDLLAFMGFLYRKIRLSKLNILLRAIPSFNKMKKEFFSQMLKKYYEVECDKGGGLLILAQKYGDRKDG